ncbi:MAG: PAS domain S-box protein [Bacteroidales bacterium]|nr:PAS domain S-box protein [Bacteroidales bacterium]
MSIRDLIKYSAVPSVIVDKNDLKIIHVNEKATVLSQWPGPELIGKFLSDLFNPVSGEPRDYDGVILRTKDGNELSVHVNIQSIAEHDNLLVSLWATNYYEKKNTLEKEVESWRLAFDNYGSPVTIHSSDYVLLDANKAACKAFGMTKDQLVGRKCYELFHGKRNPTVGCPMKALIESGHHTSQVVEIESLKENAVVDCSPVFDRDGKLERIIHTAIEVKSIIKMKKELASKKIILDREEQYRAITQSASDAIITLDTKGKIVGWNPGASKIFGYKEDEMISKKLSNIIPQDYLKRHQNGFDDSVKESKHSIIGKTIEVRGMRKNKTEFPAELSLSEWEISSGRFYTATIRDISIRKLQEEALKDERNFSEAVLQSLPGIFYLFTYPELRLTRWNKYHEKLLGFTGEEINDRHVTEWFLPEIRQNVLNVMKEVIEEGYKRMDQYVIAKDGRLIPCILTGVKLTLKDKQYIMGVGIDISLRKQAEEQLNKSEAQLRSLLNTIPDLVWLKDTNGVYLACNESFERYMHRSEAEIIGKTDFDLLERQRAEKFQNQDEKVIIAGKAIFNEEWTVLDNEGTKAYVETIKSPVFSSNGKFIGVLGIGHDMTDRKKAEAEIQSANEQLKKINGEKDKFFSIIAHDLRNPLTSFLGLTQIMDENLHGLSMEEIEEMTRIMNKSANNLFQLLENLLSWANMQQGLISYKPQAISLLQLVEAVIEQSIDEPANAKKIEVNNSISSQINVFADENMIQSVIRNLLSNALKFTKKGGKIFLRAATKDNFVEVQIEDNGVGMNREILKNLFVLNANTSRPGTDGEPSTGLGLSLCDEFIKKHGGKIWAESEEGKGSVFHFTLPVKSHSRK